MALHSKTAIVVGASSGVGAAVARLLAGEARKVAVLARRQEELDQLVAEIGEKVGATRVHAYRHDVADLEEVDALFDRIKRISEAAGYSSPEEFVVHVIEKELSVIESADTNEDVTERLKGLGYLE